eukprot:CAMPEP_0115677872 /NCGR_PEP_ID=MMETSP0272-20121206/55454_1 /TAXON_ID=71861 /ORGANISM="Scrippsiella trochoidea, Strain CCMP3099" /LENGTH=105 /DNA_ID=CAMNT_0003117013 /DNA_START=196 /DNA_END=514 /DNA_ORIENTATION=-
MARHSTSPQGVPSAGGRKHLEVRACAHKPRGTCQRAVHTAAIGVGTGRAELLTPDEGIREHAAGRLCRDTTLPLLPVFDAFAVRGLPQLTFGEALRELNAARHSN